MSKLTDTYAAAFAACTTAAELEHALQNGPPHPFRGAPWRRISDARIEAGRRICAAHPLGFYIPLVGERRKLTVCGETYRVGYGQNGAGERYAWHGAQSWVNPSKSGTASRGGPLTPSGIPPSITRTARSPS